MPIYYPPPPPFMGGQQPHEPAQLTPPSNPPATDDPPFTRRGGREAVYAALVAWQPVPASPPTGAKLVPIAVVVEDKVPWVSFAQRLAGLWTPVPLLPQLNREIAALPGVSVDPPPIHVLSTPVTVLAAWFPAFVAPQVAGHLPIAVTAVAVNDPPFGIRPWLTSVVGSWQPPAPPPYSPHVVPPETVIPPVGGEQRRERRRWMWHQSSD